MLDMKREKLYKILFIKINFIFNIGSTLSPPQVLNNKINVCFILHYNFKRSGVLIILWCYVNINKNLLTIDY